MKFIVKENANVYLYCTKKDILALMKSDEIPADDILEKVWNLKEDEYARFENKSHVAYLNNHPWLISYAEIKKCKSQIQTYIDRLYGHLAYLAYYENEYEDTMSETLQHRKVQLEDECLYQIESLESFDSVLDTLPMLPNKNWLDLQLDEYAMYGSYFDNILYIEHKDHSPISLEDQIPFWLIQTGVKFAVSNNKIYEQVENYSYEIVPDFVENKWFIVIKILKTNETNKKHRIFSKKRETRK